MEKMTICYEFVFRLTIRKKNGRLYNGHIITGLGLTFGVALWDIYSKLKKRKSEIITICEVKEVRIAFAFGKDASPLKISIADYPPDMPEDYQKELNYLPKKQQ